MADRIFIEGFLIHAAHGVHAHEHRESQDFLIDISVDVDASKAGISDKIDDTVDYDRLREIVTSVFAGASRYLLERLASQVAEQILQDPRIAETTVTIRKPHVYKDCVPGVSITRKRPFSL